MSGVKYSQVELEREQRARQEALSEIENLLRQLRATGEKIKRLNASIPDGVLKSFPDVFTQVQSFRSQQGRNIPSYSADMDSTSLKEAARKIEACCRKDQELLRQLVEVKEVRRDAKARELVSRVEVLKNRLYGTRHLLDKWQPGELERQERVLSGLYPEIEQGNFVSVAETCNRFEGTVTRLFSEVSTLESQDRQRLYVLDALKEVCQEMGWKVDEEPALEDPDNPRSAYLLSVNTYSAGQMTFRLSLDGIHVDAPFGTQDRLCYRQFDDFSERLKKLGVKTKFKRVNAPDEDPKLKTSDELGFGYEESEDMMEV